MATNSGNICIDSRPTGADIHFDGIACSEKTPARLSDKEAGCHTVQVSVPGNPDWPPASKTIEVTAGKTSSLVLTIMTKENRMKIRVIAWYTFLFMIFLVGLALMNRLGRIPMPDDLTKNILYFACAGGIGSLAFNMYEYIFHLGEGDFNIDYYLWYLFRPFVGMIYGTFLLFLIAGGAMALTSAPSFDTLFTTKTVMFYLAISFLAGYAEEPVSLQLKAVAEALFKKPGDEDKTGRTTK